MRLRPAAQAIAITGFMGTGKSTVGRMVASELGLPHVDTDARIHAKAGRSIPAIFADDGEERFRELETRALKEALQSGACVLSTGGGMLIREENRRILREAGPVICLTASVDEILERVATDGSRPLLAVDDPAAKVGALLAERAAVYAQADYEVDTSGLEPAAVRDRVMDVLEGDARARWYTSAPTAVPVEVEPRAYEVTVGRGLLSRLGELFPSREVGTRAAIVTTDRIGPLYAQTVRESLGDGGWEPRVLTVPDGEASKSLERLRELCGEMARAGLDRGSTAFALGGGVIGDLAGFAAAVFMRGIDVVHLPTSLLAQVDSSIGGKTAVDLAEGKNLVGAFHQPVGVFGDVAALGSLPEPEMRSGLGEMIKHAACFDAELFGILEGLAGRDPRDDGASLEYLVARNCQIKAGVVAEDPREQSVRAVLNYGHTVGHALERAAAGWSLRHGEVVGIGIVAESRLATWLGLADEETAERQRRVVEDLGLPVEARGVDEQAALSALERDKKIVSGRVRLPLVPEIGSFRIVEDVDMGLVREAVRSVLG